MRIPANVIDQLINGAQSDIRQVLNMLSTWKLSNNSMDFDEGKNLYVYHVAHSREPLTDDIYRAKLNEKFSIMTPFDIINKMLGPYMFSNTSRETLGDKMELYFHDHSFVPLFIQVSYSKDMRYFSD
jgi:replication factor C subunit 1